MAQDDALRRNTMNSPEDGDDVSTEHDGLRRDMDDSRRRISETVTEIEHRVRPGYVVARRRERIRRRLTDWKDSVFGNDEPEYPANRFRTHGVGSNSYDARRDDGGEAGLLDRGRERGAEAAHAVSETPQLIRRQTRGNPLAAGAVALGAGWLIGSVFPESRRERDLVARHEPELVRTAGAAQGEMADAAHTIRDAALDAVDHVKDAGRDATEGVADQAKDAAGSAAKR